ncbi:MAG TPA: flagellar protein FlaG [Firmicutes bacterium]|nr:flagellar protein FlaG [Bacillota bacterium]
MKVDGIEPPVLQRVQDQTRQKRVEQPQGERADLATRRRQQAAGQQQPGLEGRSNLEIIEDEVKRLNETAYLYNIGLRFSIHEETSRVVVQVYNREDNEVIRQIPPEKILNLVAQIQQMIGLLIDEER